MDFLNIIDGNTTYIFLGIPGKEIKADFRESITQNTRFEGPQESTDFNEVHTFTQELNKKRQQLNTDFQAGQIDRMGAMNRFNEINQEWSDYARNFVDQHPNSPAVLSCLSVYHPIEDLEIYKSTLQALKPRMGGSDYIKNLEAQITRNEGQATAYLQQKKAEEEREKLLAEGNVAPEISLPNPDGKVINLSDLRGKYVLIDFWASWCKPCRRENPNVVNAYKKYKSKGFEILSVSLDKNKSAWVNAIKSDNMTWKHVSDLKFWNSEAAQKYGVNSIPFTLLIDPEGKIVAKNLRGEALHNTLAKLLNT
ncbi:TlpA family protein disulfide reductase [Luteibaculum oceani]|uniref:TlpA family protein disulfide reductase n=2 Tax=Luteibaculum oceani TaxID=1294296 RepID=A0A5C6V0L8_9FLAO|nr:TlpA family protein disulfide reductase [Luteibaculum oceani]